MTVTTLHNRPGPNEQRLSDQKKTVDDLLGALGGTDEKLDEIDRCLNELLHRATGAHHDLDHIDYEDAIEDLEAARRAIRSLTRITTPLQTRVDALLAVQQAAAATDPGFSC